MIINQNLFQFIASHQEEILKLTLEHIGLTVISLLIAVCIGIPIGIIISRYRKLADLTLGGVGIIQTIPSLALLGFLLPFFGIGPVPAIIALFLYALLPIVRNTYTGIEGIDPSIKEAAIGMGMSNTQTLFKIELPLAMPVIFAGVRIATVVNVGVATLCALIASGGLGELIYRGIALNNTNMILAGAIPAAILALFFDLILGTLQKFTKYILKPAFILFLFLIFITVPFTSSFLFNNSFSAGFVPEFMERADGYLGLKKIYGLNLITKEMDSQLMFQALQAKKVDLISGYSTEGRIQAYKFKILKDDKNLFPSYEAVPLINGKSLRKYPNLKNIFLKIEGKFTNEKITELNYRVEFNKENIHSVAKDYLTYLGLKTDVTRNGKANIIIGSKNFTEQFLLAEIFALLIENYSNLNVEVKKGLAGTKLCFDALKKGEIDIYPEYTGTALYVILKANSENTPLLFKNRNYVYNYVKEKTKALFDVEWLQPLGFNNTWALMMREDEANKHMIVTISDLKNYLDRNGRI